MQINKGFLLCKEELLFTTKCRLVTGWPLIITSDVNSNSACCYTPSPSVDIISYLICFFFVTVYISGHKQPTGHVELSHKLDQGSCWPNWSRNFHCGHLFLYSTNWLSGWAKHLEMWRPRAVRNSLFLFSDPGPLDQALLNWDRGNQAKNIEGNKSFNERLPLKTSIAQRSELLFEIYAASSNLQRKIQFPTVCSLQ